MNQDNLELWNSVEKTDPNHTKKVSQRGGFTAIDAHYQVQQVTAQFGPVGIGWGYDCEYLFEDKAVICLLTFWHTKRENKFGPIAGCAKFIDGRLDADAPKKSMTDALTKAISHLGFNADVFLGKFDDNKYVEKMKEEFAPPKMTPEDAKTLLSATKSIDDLVKAWKSLPIDLKQDESVASEKETQKQKLTESK